MTTNGNVDVTSSSSVVDCRLGNEMVNGNATDMGDLDSPEDTAKRKYFNSPEITCSPSPCVFDYDRFNGIRESTGNHHVFCF